MLRSFALCLLLALGLSVLGDENEPRYMDPINVEVPHVSTDSSITIDYDIVYVRADRAGDDVHKRYFADFSQPVTIEPGADLMLLHPDGSEEFLVEVGAKQSIMDPVVSFNGEWVYYTLCHDTEKQDQYDPPSAGADIYKIHVKSRKIVRLTNQKFTPNLGAANWSDNFREWTSGKSWFRYGVFNTGPCPLPDGRVMFTSNRDGFVPARGYPAIAMQLFVMDDRDTSIGIDDDPQNLEKIGHLNLAGALHPIVLKDGRVMYSTLESEGIRNEISWGIWTIHPDGTQWNPLVSAFDTTSAPNGFHFQTQLSDGSIVFEEYYNQNNSGFGAYLKMPPSPEEGYAPFGPGYMDDERNAAWRYGRHYNGKPRWNKMPFTPTGSISLTPFTHGREGPADPSRLNDESSPAVGKFTHPSGAPDNHLLTAYSPGPVNHQYEHKPNVDSGIYIIKHGAVIEEPAAMRMIKNDPRYNECWPRALVPYERIYGIVEPKNLPSLANDGQTSKHLPEGTPFGLVGTSSFLKRESFPNGKVHEGTVTAAFPGGDDPFQGLEAFSSHGHSSTLNWNHQGADAGLYSNEDVHAVRILAMEPTTDRRGADEHRRYRSHAGERLRILGEIPLRKFEDGKQPLDPDGNPDTSILAKIPADVGFTFQTLDKKGMVLNMAQTWHQLRPGEMRVDCGGCHAHSQKPTDFKLTAAAKPDAKVWNLINETPILTSPDKDESKTQWDAENDSGLRFVENGPLNVEYYRDIKPIFQRSCVACHSGDTPAAKLNLDADDEGVDVKFVGPMPGTYYRLAMDDEAKFGTKPSGWPSWGFPNASRYVRMFQSRRSLLTWKIHGERLDGFKNDDLPSPVSPEYPDQLHWHGKPVDLEPNRRIYDLDYVGTPMPPPEAVKAGKVQPLSDEDRRTIVRWIDLGCPIDFDHGKEISRGWMLDDQRPTLTLTHPKRGNNTMLTQIMVGLWDYGTGLKPGSMSVTASFPIDGLPAGTNLAAYMEPASQGVYVYNLRTPITTLKTGDIHLSISDNQGNVTDLTRTFKVGQE